MWAVKKNGYAEQDIVVSAWDPRVCLWSSGLPWSLLTPDLTHRQALNLSMILLPNFLSAGVANLAAVCAVRAVFVFSALRISISVCPYHRHETSTELTFLYTVEQFTIPRVPQLLATAILLLFGFNLWAPRLSGIVVFAACASLVCWAAVWVCSRLLQSYSYVDVRVQVLVWTYVFPFCEIDGEEDALCILYSNCIPRVTVLVHQGLLKGKWHSYPVCKEFG